MSGAIPPHIHYAFIAWCSVKKSTEITLPFTFTTPWRRIGEWRCGSTQSLTSALDGGKWSASRPGRFTPRERAPDTHWIGVWVGPRAVLDTVVKRKIPSPRRESNPRTPIVQPVVQRYTDWAIPALIWTVVKWNNRGMEGKYVTRFFTIYIRSLRLLG
jgi:hypothetical protein